MFGKKLLKRIGLLIAIIISVIAPCVTYDSGLDRGLELGHQEGYYEGLDDGFEDGYIEGVDVGRHGYFVTSVFKYAVGPLNAIPIEIYPALTGSPERPGILWFSWEWAPKSTLTFNIAIWDYNTHEKILPHYNTTATPFVLEIQAEGPVKFIIRYGWDDPMVPGGEQIPIVMGFFVAEWATVFHVMDRPDVEAQEEMLVHLGENQNEEIP